MSVGELGTNQFGFPWGHICKGKREAEGDGGEGHRRPGASVWFSWGRGWHTGSTRGGTLTSNIMRSLHMVGMSQIKSWGAPAPAQPRGTAVSDTPWAVVSWQGTEPLDRAHLSSPCIPPSHPRFPPPSHENTLERNELVCERHGWILFITLYLQFNLR